MTDPGEPAATQMRLRFAGRCSACGTELAAGATALYDRSRRTVACVNCPGSHPAVDDFGTAGASARREYERRHDKREDRIRTEHPKLGGLILALSDEPQSTRAWAKGARGEESLGQQLDKLAGDHIKVLHDRRIPGTKANIDHIAVAPTGVYVIDAKRYAGYPELRVQGGLFSARTEKLIVAGRDKTSLIAGMRHQLDVVSRQLVQSGFADTPTTGVLCFVDADWPLLSADFTIDGVHVTWPRKAGGLVKRAGLLGVDQVSAVASALSTLLPRA